MKRLIPDSIAALDNRLQKDDFICTINGRTLKGMTQGDALGFLKDIPKVINLGVKRDFSTPTRTRDRHNDSDVSPMLARTESISNTEKQSSQRSRPQSKEPAARRSRSETRNERSPGTPRKRPSSLSRISRLFRGSSDSINTLGRESVESSPSKTPTRTRSSSRKNKKNQPALYTIFFDKTERNAFDFTIKGGVNTIYGDSPIVIESVRRGSELSKSLRVNDQLVSIQGADVSKFPINRAIEYLSSLPLGRVCLVVQRKK